MARLRRLPVLLLLALLLAQPAGALFHLAVIDEVVTSYDGDPSSQFVEIKMLAELQQFVANSVLGVFDASGSYLGDLLVVPANVVANGPDVRWIMGTAQFQIDSGITADFLIPAGLPTTGGMVCWGAPGLIAPPPASWDHTDPDNYVDCLAYGGYTGPTSAHGGMPTPLDANGHSLVRISDTDDNLQDFVCGDPATPENNAGAVGSMPATTSCALPTPTPTPTPTVVPTATPTPTPTKKVKKAKKVKIKKAKIKKAKKTKKQKK